MSLDPDAIREQMRARMASSRDAEDELEETFDPAACGLSLDDVVRRFGSEWWRTTRHPLIHQSNLHATLARIRNEWPADNDLARASEWLRWCLEIVTAPERRKAKEKILPRSRGVRMYDEYFAMRAEEDERAFAEQRRARLVVDDARDEQATGAVSELETETYGEPGGIRLNGPLGQWCSHPGKSSSQEAPHKARSLAPNAIVHPADSRLPPIPDNPRDESWYMRRARRHVAGAYWINSWLADELEGRDGRLDAAAEVAEIRERLVRNIASALRAGLPLPLSHSQFHNNEWERLRLLSTLGGRRELAARLTKGRAATRRCRSRHRNPRAHHGLTRALRSSPAPMRGSRRTAARTTFNTGPPGADDGPSSDPPRSLDASPARRARHHATNPTHPRAPRWGIYRLAEIARTTEPPSGGSRVRQKRVGSRLNGGGAARRLSAVLPLISSRLPREKRGRHGRHGRAPSAM